MDALNDGRTRLAPPEGETEAVAAGDGRPAGPRLTKAVALVGLMGAGKTSIGRRLAHVLGAGFVDADAEIVAAAGMSIADIFATYGEPVFRDLERRVVARLLAEPPRIIALGGGAFCDSDTRQRVKEHAISFWLKADLDTLYHRTQRRKGTRPLLKGEDPRTVLARLMAERHPVYAEADHTVDSNDRPADFIVGQIVSVLEQEAT